MRDRETNRWIHSTVVHCDSKDILELNNIVYDQYSINKYRTVSPRSFVTPKISFPSIGLFRILAVTKGWISLLRITPKASQRRSLWIFTNSKILSAHSSHKNESRNAIFFNIIRNKSVHVNIVGTVDSLFLHTLYTSEGYRIYNKKA